MKSNSLTAILLHIAFALFVVSSSAVNAEGHSEESFDIGKITCWDYTALENSDRVAAASLVYGFVAGKMGIPVQSANSIKGAVEHADKLCDANPDMYVARAIERALEKQTTK